MNTFAELELYHRGPYVTFYTVWYEIDEGNYQEYSLTDAFFNEFHQDKHPLREAAEQIANLIAILGKRKRGVDRGHDLRFENSANALPPKQRLVPREIRSNHHNPLRLYCYHVTSQIVILFSGGLKTTHNPKDCPNVRSHFNRAIQLADELDELFRDREIRVDGNELSCDRPIIKWPTKSL